MKKIEFLIIVSIIFFPMFQENSVSEVKSNSLFVSPLVGGYHFEGDENIESGQVAGFGAGYNLSENLAIELTSKWGKFDRTYCNEVCCDEIVDEVDGYLRSIDALFHFSPEQNMVPYFSVGMGYLDLDHPTTKNERNDFVNYGAGFHYFLTQSMALRGDVKHIVTLDESHNNFTWSVGLTYFIGGRKDSDNDGVDDAYDNCPNTSAGTKVTSNGCPPDSDNDGVYDFLDKCPNTPDGEPVDKKGCQIDSDSDGIFDNKDKCPNTPTILVVDKQGCPLDSDKDGVFNYKDKCPGTPAGATVNKEGCPMDDDNDGVYNYKDKCPKTPPETLVDSDGCMLDSDGDGVPDLKDKCPSTPIGAVVDKQGCWKVLDIVFDSDKWDIKPKYYNTLNKIVKIISQNPDMYFIIQGHTDSTGSPRSNMELSHKRANSVMEYLVKKGIPAERLQAEGFGDSVPIAPNDTPENKAKNRRVQLDTIK